MKMTMMFLGAALCLLAGSAFAQEAAKPTPPYRVIDNTYSVGTYNNSVFLITTSKGNILLDVGPKDNAETIEKNVQALGFKLIDIKILLNSHAHNDHAGGIAKLKADTGAMLVASEGDRYALEKGVFVGSESNIKLNFTPVKVDKAVKDGESIELGGLKLTAHVTPGHTKGCTSWSWPVRDADGSAHTAIDFCSATVSRNSLVPEQYPGIIADYRSTFATAKSLPGDVFLAPHPEFYGPEAKQAKLGLPGPNPFIDRAGFERLVDYQRDLFEKALAEQNAAARK